jgi:magnesium transporter
MSTPKPTLPDPTPELLYLLAGDPGEFREVAHALAPVELADALRRLPPDAAARVLGALPHERAVAVLDEPEFEDVRADILQRLESGQAARLVEGMAADAQADLVRELDDPERDALMARLAPETQASLDLLLQYRPDTAGGIMTTEFLSVAADRTVASTLELIRRVGRSKETVYAVYVTDPVTGAIVHVASLRELVLAEPSALMRDAGEARSVVTVPADMDREEVARIIGKYNLLAVPVVDAAGRVLGIVTVDDVMDAMVREGTEDVQKFGGVQALDEPYTAVGFVPMIRKRAGWLCLLFLGEMLTATAMQHFEGELARAVVLTLFVPLIVSSGGNSGSQATSLIIRALALRELGLRDWWKVALRELPSGLVLGAILGAIGIARITAWQLTGLYDYGTHWLLIAATVGAALVGVVTFGTLAGSMLPFILKRAGFDPASASAPFVATLVDVTGLVIYFSVAYVMLRGTLL